jgi:hypothetical protein
MPAGSEYGMITINDTPRHTAPATPRTAHINNRLRTSTATVSTKDVYNAAVFF